MPLMSLQHAYVENREAGVTHDRFGFVSMPSREGAVRAESGGNAGAPGYDAQTPVTVGTQPHDAHCFEHRLHLARAARPGTA